MPFLKIDLSSMSWSLDTCNNHFNAVVSFWDPFVKKKKKKESNVKWPNKRSVTCYKSNNHSFVAAIRLGCYSSAHLSDAMSPAARQTFRLMLLLKLK